MLNNKLSTSKFWLWFGWVVVNALGGAIGVLACAATGIENLTDYPQITIFALTTAITVSTCQAIFVQKQYIPKQRTAIVTVWIFISSFCSALMIIAAPIIMFLVALLLISIPSSGTSGQGVQYLFFGLMFIIFGLISGVVTGFAQHFVLSGAAGKSKRRWIIYSGIGGALGLGIAAIIVSVFFKEPIFIMDGYSKAKSLSMYGMTVFNTIGGIINGAVTGIEIVRLFGELHPRFSSVHEE
ncbi:hypothetical protein NIES2101_25625 [Calothrix sp. HK-06]|nr:hypothetical protein NIES2101_25625 [Calothrix sp. HK-06]